MEAASHFDADLHMMEAKIVPAPAKSEKIVRRKFAVPPVKVACLECRASRTRCDGKPECSNCTAKGKTCIYTQSKRGGSRIRKRKSSTAELLDNRDFNQCSLSILPELNQASFAQPLSLVAPGGGLRQLDLSLDESDFMYDALFGLRGENDSGYDTEERGVSASVGEPVAFVRTYGSDKDILGAYYTYIHSYFPVLPPPEIHQVIDNPELGIRTNPHGILNSPNALDSIPSSPLSLAISASLALIPHPDDPDPSGNVSIHYRREQAQALAQLAFESIEMESEIPESTTQPGEVLSSEPASITRTPFHPRNPLENESIIALLLLSTYEYGQRGNISKMRRRAGQALTDAMNLGLHAKGDEDGYFQEANRRVWWMTYVAVCQGSILSNSPSPVLIYDPRFTTPRPTTEVDSEAWSLFIQAQQVIVAVTQFVIDLDVTMKTNSDTATIWQRMLELENFIGPIVLKADTWASEPHPPVLLDRTELKVSQALRGTARIKVNSARIKLHRYCAFADVPVFAKKHCDLKCASDFALPDLNSPMVPTCSCSSTFHQLPLLGGLSLDSPVAQNCGILPFSSLFSARICLKSALAIAQSFSSLPFPQPISSSSISLSNFSPMKDARLPRMIPVFSCCAMQSAYAMIMLTFQTRAVGSVGSPGEGPAKELLGQLDMGLQLILEALKNYSLANEALGGQIDQIQLAIESVDTLQDAGAFDDQIRL